MHLSTQFGVDSHEVLLHVLPGHFENALELTYESWPKSDGLQDVLWDLARVQQVEVGFALRIHDRFGILLRVGYRKVVVVQLAELS